VSIPGELDPTGWGYTNRPIGAVSAPGEIVAMVVATHLYAVSHEFVETAPKPLWRGLLTARLRDADETHSG